jgi:carbonic anhydrase
MFVQPLDDQVPAADPFADVVAANRAHVETFTPIVAAGVARRELAVVTCMDSRIDPLAMLGLSPGDAKILRNAGARVTDDVLRTLVLAAYLLGVRRVMVVAHTGCRMSGCTEADVHEAIAASGGPDTTSLSFLTTTDQEQALYTDVARVRAWPYLTDLVVGGFIYDLQSGALRRVI